MGHTEIIRELLAQKPGLRAQQIANELGLERSQVVSTLHGLLEGEVVQDNPYRRWPKARRPRAAEAEPARTFLAELCRY